MLLAVLITPPITLFIISFYTAKSCKFLEPPLLAKNASMRLLTLKFKPVLCKVSLRVSFKLSKKPPPETSRFSRTFLSFGSPDFYLSSSSFLTICLVNVFATFALPLFNSVVSAASYSYPCP